MGGRDETGCESGRMPGVSAANDMVSATPWPGGKQQVTRRRKGAKKAEESVWV